MYLYRFDYGNFTPSSPEAGVPFVQMLATTDPELAMMEFQSIRENQVRQSASKLAQGQMQGTGALVVEDGAAALLAQSTQNAHNKRATGLEPVVVFHDHQLSGVRSRPGVTNCMNQIADAYGPVVLALLVGTFVVALLTSIAAVAVGIRALVRSKRSGTGYYHCETVKS